MELLSNSGTLSVQNSEFTLSGGASLTAGSFDVAGSTVVLSDNFTKTGGSVTATTATLALGKNVKITSNDELTFKELDLNGYSLTLGSATSDLTVSNAVTLDNSTEEINAGECRLDLDRRFNIDQRKLKQMAEPFHSVIPAQIATDGMLDVSGGTLSPECWFECCRNFKTDNTTTLTLNNNALDLSGGQAATGGVLEQWKV